jgi:hypothetical protein
MIAISKANDRNPQNGLLAMNNEKMVPPRSIQMPISPQRIEKDFVTL